MPCNEWPQSLEYQKTEEGLNGLPANTACAALTCSQPEGSEAVSNAGIFSVHSTFCSHFLISGAWSYFTQAAFKEVRQFTCHLQNTPLRTQESTSMDLHKPSGPQAEEWHKINCANWQISPVGAVMGPVSLQQCFIWRSQNTGRQGIAGPTTSHSVPVFSFTHIVVRSSCLLSAGF